MSPGAGLFAFAIGYAALLFFAYRWLFGTVLLGVELWRGRRTVLWLKIFVAVGWALYFLVVWQIMRTTLFAGDMILAPTFAVATLLSWSGLRRNKNGRNALKRVPADGQDDSSAEAR